MGSDPIEIFNGVCPHLKTVTSFHLSVVSVRRLSALRPPFRLLDPFVRGYLRRRGSIAAGALGRQGKRERHQRCTIV